MVQTASGVRCVQTPNSCQATRLPSDETVVASGRKHPPATKRRLSHQSCYTASKCSRTVVILDDIEEQDEPISTSVTSSPRASSRKWRPTQRSHEYLSQSPRLGAAMSSTSKDNNVSHNEVSGDESVGTNAILLQRSKMSDAMKKMNQRLFAQDKERMRLGAFAT